MNRRSTISRRCREVVPVVLATCLAAGCLQPPCCPCTQVATALSARFAEPGAESKTLGEAPAGSAQPPSAALIVWDGEAENERGSGWASCQEDQKEACQTRLEAKAGAGRGGSVGLQFTARGTEWMGFGWNWLSWWPKGGGTDISRYHSLSLSIRVVGERGKAPEPFTVRIALGGSALAGKDETESIPVVDYAPSFADGQWHEVSLPIEPMLRGKGEQFNTQKAWSFTIGAWNQGEREYDIFVDDVRFL